MGQQYPTFVLLFVTAGILRAPSSDSYSWVSYGLFFASMRTAPVTWELLSSSRYGIAHSHKPFSSLCAFEICTPTGFWKLNEGLLHLQSSLLLEAWRTNASVSTVDQRNSSLLRKERGTAKRFHGYVQKCPSLY